MRGFITMIYVQVMEYCTAVKIFLIQEYLLT